VTQAIVRSVKTPVLLVRAANGILASEHDVRVRFGALEQLEIVTIADVRHHLHLEAPDAVARQIRRAWGEP
jgi:pimeloyl-ACP methyl ester carboxylesterase